MPEAARPLLGLLAALPLIAQPGVEVLTFHSAIDNSEQSYAVSAPSSFRPGKTYPLLISLHQEHSSHRLNLRQVLGGDPSLAITRRPEAVIACPMARGTMGYQGIAEADIYDVVADAERRFPIDPDRVYLTGISMGGAGALHLALTRPDVWAAVAPVCPAADPGLDRLAGNALNLPVRIFQGQEDPIIPVDVARAWHRRLVDAGVAADYLEYPGVAHNAWTVGFRNGALFEWLTQFHRNHFPERVRFSTAAYRYSTAYWVRIDGLTPGTLASIDAQRRGPAQISVETANLDGFTLTPEGPAPQWWIVTIDGVALRLKPAAALSFEKVNGRWRAGLFRPRGKRPGAEGPIVESVSGRHIYVYGTLGSPTPERLAERKRRAEHAAAWAEPDSPLTLTLSVKADTALTAEDLATADLVLFGSAATNAAIARLAPTLPITLNPGAADWGLLYIAPAGAHTVLVSSGLPWWTGAEARPGGWPFAPPQLRLLSTFGDYILFKGSLANVAAEGRFDAQWKLAPAAREKLAASGTVSIP